MEVIAERLGVSGSPVSTVWLARELLISTVEASKKIQEFVEEQGADADQYHLKYAICGAGKKKDGLRTVDYLIKIVNAKDLENAKEQYFETVSSCLVYCASLNDTSLNNILELSNASNSRFELNEQNLGKTGVYRTHTDSISKGTIQVKQENVKSDVVDSHTSTKAQPVVETKVIKEETKKPLYTSRKSSAATSANRETSSPVPSKPVYVSRKRNADSNPPTSTKKSKPVDNSSSKAQQKKELEEMLANDSGFSEDEDFKTVVDDPQDVEENQQEYMYNDIDVADEEEQPSAEKEVTPTQGEEGTSKRRQTLLETKLNTPSEVDRSAAEIVPEDVPEVMEIDEGDGYITTKRNKKPSQPAAPSSAPKRTFTIDTESSGQQKKKQSNLMSFFKKK